MWVWAALCCAAAAVSVTADCDVSIGRDTYWRQTLVGDIVDPNGLAVDYTTNLLYFGYYSDWWRSAKVDLSTGVFNKIEELPDRCTFTVDQVHQQVHAGCSGDDDERQPDRGLYQFDSNTDQFELAGAAGERVMFIYYNDVLYYSFWHPFLLHTFRKGHGVRVSDLSSQVYGLVIDKNKDRIFYNKTGLYRQPAGAGAGAGATFRYARLGHPRALAVDSYGDAYVCTHSADTGGIYRLHELTARATKLLDVKSCNGLIFDRDDNIIYSDIVRIVRLLKC